MITKAQKELLINLAANNELFAALDKAKICARETIHRQAYFGGPYSRTYEWRRFNGIPMVDTFEHFTKKRVGMCHMVYYSSTESVRVITYTDDWEEIAVAVEAKLRAKGWTITVNPEQDD